MKIVMLSIAVFCTILVFYAWVRTIIFVNSNAKRNNLNYLLWTLLTIIFPFFVGFIMYVIFRKTGEISKDEAIEIRKVVNTVVSVIIVVVCIIILTGIVNYLFL